MILLDDNNLKHNTMASLKGIKKDIDYLVEEVISDCYVALYFNDDQKKYDKILVIITEAVEFRNGMFDQANNPPEKNNKSLVKKHYAHLRRTMLEKVDDMFAKLSDIVNKK